MHDLHFRCRAAMRAHSILIAGLKRIHAKPRFLSVLTIHLSLGLNIVRKAKRLNIDLTAPYDLFLLLSCDVSSPLLLSRRRKHAFIYFIPLLRVCRKKGAILNISSASGMYPVPLLTVYSASKVNAVHGA